MARISVAMMTHNETAEFRWLMEALVPALDVIDEIVIVDDFSDVEFTEAVRSLTMTSGPPHVLVAHTVFGKGVSFMENRLEWHYWPMTDEQLDEALAELAGA